ncbi:serine hydrolase domain-containing protein [Actinocatenispora rupis]|uniref:Serine hydrolase n=1 Tax=Actinocatenispora rupis TaxID=519421 RepID=A0A8J3JE53_9ACTN|nr:serine hydrolase domain-containing protein [Actinocatenispora rupis]GID14817.1 serine hydrolase [Actinocatenispora rupis]
MSDSAVPDGARLHYERLVRRAQRSARVPAVQVAVHRADRPLWTFEVGDAGGGVELGPETQFRIGSITKTFTAVLVMQCRDDGLLDLDDPVSAHLDVPEPHRELTVRRLLTHTAGLQREPYGDIWDTLAVPSLDETLAGLAHAERILPSGRRFHYSNLGFALLGHLVAARRGAPWAEVLADRILTPLDLHLTLQPGENAATGYLVDAWSDHARPEPRTDLGGIAPAAQLWGTAAELARWGSFLADPVHQDPKGAVLAADTLAEMRHPQALRDDRVWKAGWGLGLIVRPGADRAVDVGHGGAMPGFLAEAYGRVPGAEDVPPGLAAAVLLSSGTADGALGLSFDLMEAAVERDPADIEPWHVGEPAPPELRSVLGHWWGEGFEYVFRWRAGHLEASGVGEPVGTPPAVFAVESADLLRSVAGREIGEQLRLTRDADGRVVRLHWATYRFTREQQTFDGVWSSQP